MSVVSECHGHEDAPELIDARHRCVHCGATLVGRGHWAGRAGDYCVKCGAEILEIIRDDTCEVGPGWWPEWTFTPAPKVADGRR